MTWPELQTPELKISINHPVYIRNYVNSAFYTLYFTCTNISASVTYQNVYQGFHVTDKIFLDQPVCKVFTSTSALMLLSVSSRILFLHPHLHQTTRRHTPQDSNLLHRSYMSTPLLAGVRHATKLNKTTSPVLTSSG
jgi:hypothetical protein